MKTALLAFLAGYFAILIGSSFLRQKHVPGRAIFLFRAFFPSWRFFEDLGDVPSLSYRVAERGGDFGAWQACLEKTDRKWHELFLNSRGNFLLACGSLLQHLMRDIEETDESKPEEIENSVSYKLTRNLVLSRIAGVTRPLRYQFKLTVGQDDVLTSPSYET